MVINEYITSTPELVKEVKTAYNRLLKRMKEADKFLDDNTKSIDERLKYVLIYKIELLDPLGDYIALLKGWNELVTDFEMEHGFIL